jgi:hypothetical protein
LSASPNNFVVAALTGHVAREDQYELIENIDAVRMKPNTLGGNICHHATSRRHADPEFYGREATEAMTRGSASFFEIRQAHAGQLQAAAVPRQLAQRLSVKLPTQRRLKEA